MLSPAHPTLRLSRPLVRLVAGRPAFGQRVAADLAASAFSARPARSFRAPHRHARANAAALIA